MSERAAVLGHGTAELAASIDDRTLQILARRRTSTGIRRRGWLVRRMLLTADLLGLVAAALLAEWLFSRNRNQGLFDPRAEVIIFLASLPGWVLVARAHGLYDGDEERTDHSTADDLAGVFHVVTVCTWLFAVVSYLTGLAHPTAAKLVVFWAAAIGLVSLGRATGRFAARRSVTYLQNAVVVGAGDVGQFIAKKILHHPEYGINLVGLVDSAPKTLGPGLEHLALLGGTDRLHDVVRLLDVERVIVAFTDEAHEETLELIRGLKAMDADIQVDIVPRLFEAIGPNVMLHSIEGVALLAVPPVKLSRSSEFLKRASDVVIAAMAIAMLLPCMLLICLATWFDSGWPVIYRRRVLGRSGLEFDAFKFRTMRPEFCVGERYGAEGASDALREILADPEKEREYELRHKLLSDPRVTRFGRILRRSSLDELPQLFNVIRGEMSVVGPRMITSEELRHYGREKDMLLSIRPGLTGYWQINGRSSVEYSDRVRLDLAYIGGWSMSLDMSIILRTVRAMVAARGAH